MNADTGFLFYLGPQAFELGVTRAHHPGAVQKFPGLALVVARPLNGGEQQHRVEIFRMILDQGGGECFCRRQVVLVIGNLRFAEGCIRVLRILPQQHVELPRRTPIMALLQIHLRQQQSSLAILRIGREQGQEVLTCRPIVLEHHLQPCHLQLIAHFRGASA